MKIIQHLDMSAYLAEYTAKVNAEAKAAEAIREAVRNGPPRPLPTERWNISDRD